MLEGWKAELTLVLVIYQDPLTMRYHETERGATDLQRNWAFCCMGSFK